jgi:hypothetical protein
MARITLTGLLQQIASRLDVLTGLNVGTPTGQAVLTAANAAAARTAIAAVGTGDVTPVAVAYASSVTLNHTTGINFNIAALTGNITIDASNGQDGKDLNILVTQDATGSRTVALSSNFAQIKSVAFSANTAANGKTLIRARYMAALSKFVVLDVTQYD